MKSLKQYFKNLFFCFLVISFSIFSCKEDSNPADNIPFAQTITKTITPKDGGVLELTNNKGDKIILSIPKYALNEKTAITLQLLNKTESNPFLKNLINTIQILPDGTKLKHAAKLKIIFNSQIADTALTILYCRKDSELAYPLYKTEVTTNSVTGETYHFSKYGSAEPTGEEIISQSEKMKTSSGVDLWDWQGFSDLVRGMLQYIEMLQMIGETERAAELMDTLEQRIIEHVNAFLDLPIPNEPCGYYQQALFKYAELVMMLTSDEQLIERISNRILDIRNSCWIRGEVEYDHDYTYNVQDGTIHRTIKGFVPYIVNTYNEPYGEISGSGNIDWLGIEEVAGCVGTESVTGNVIFSGELEADEHGYPWLNFVMNESWSGSITVVCPNGTATYPFNPPSSTETVRFLLEEGYTVMQPVPGASGQFKWILHVNFQP
jgi:hypothetical protein